MKPGAVLVDIAIVQGGCSKAFDRPPTTTRRSPCTTRCFTAWRTCHLGAEASTYALTNATMLAPSALPTMAGGRRAGASARMAFSAHEGALLSRQVATDLGCRSPSPPACWLTLGRSRRASGEVRKR